MRGGVLSEVSSIVGRRCRRRDHHANVLIVLDCNFDNFSVSSALFKACKLGDVGNLS